MTRLRPAPAVLLTIFLALAAAASLTMVPAGAQSSTGAQHSHAHVCDKAPAGQARCHALVATANDGVTPYATTSPSAGAYGPADLRSAYGLPNTTDGGGMTIAIVDAYDNPNAASDLAAYRSQYGLPACTTASGCFAKVNQSGATSPLPAARVGWGQEIDLDIEMASAACPLCNIRLVEAASSNLSDLGAAVDTAANVLHANAISNSYGSSEFSSETSSSVEGHFNHPGAAITVSSGDNGYGVEFPAASRYVTAVGGTSLRRDSSSRGWGETAWSGAGSGCSAYVPKPAYQTDSGCARRTVADVSAVADPNTGVAVYDSYGSSGGANWYIFGGTSVAAPIVAGVYALGGHTSTIGNAAGLYSHTASLWDVTSGSNGTCGLSYLCTAGAGYDGPTGLGTPSGSIAFGGVASTTTSTTTSTTSTTAPPSTQLVANGGFETGSLASWATGGGAPTPVASSAKHHAGGWSALLGTAGTSGTEPTGNSSVAQYVTIPSTATKATLSFWYWPSTTDSVTYDWQEARIRSSSGATLAKVFKTASNSQTWTQVTFDLTSYRGTTIQLWFNAHQDGHGDLTAMYLDDVTATVT